MICICARLYLGLEDFSFFKICSTDSMSDVLEKLFSKKYTESYHKFWLNKIVVAIFYDYALIKFLLRFITNYFSVKDLFSICKKNPHLWVGWFAFTKEIFQIKLYNLYIQGSKKKKRCAVCTVRPSIAVARLMNHAAVQFPRLAA